MTHSKKAWMRRGRGATRIGGETNDKLLDERVEVHQPQGIYRLTKAYIC